MVSKHFLTTFVATSACLLSAIQAHSLGAHGLANADPPNTPIIPEITGAFEARVRARFDSIAGNGNGYQTIIEFSNGSNTDLIWFGQYDQTSEVHLVVYIGTYGRIEKCPNHIVVGEVIEWKIGVDNSGVLSIAKIGGTSCSSASGSPPNNVVRSSKLLGDSVVYGGSYCTRILGVCIPLSTVYWTADELNGAVLGIRIRNLLEPLNRLKELDFWNLPGQLYGAFTVSFYARFDDNQSLNAKVFCFSTANHDLAVSFGRQNSLSQATLLIEQGGATYSTVTSANPITTGEMAFWHVGVDANGSGFIQKNSAALTTTGTAIVPQSTFRKNQLVGEPCHASDDKLDGVVLGFRADLHKIS